MKHTPVDTSELFKETWPGLMAVACRFVGTQTARDLVQDVFLTYLEQPPEVPVGNLRPYLYKMLKHKCLDHIRHQTVVEDYRERLAVAEARIRDIEHTTDRNDVFTHVAGRNIRELVEAAVDKLPDKCARVFRLCYFHDVSHKEIAGVMNISVRTVESHVWNAITLLRTDLKHLLMLILVFYNTH